jgi:hypothetical protein
VRIFGNLNQSSQLAQATKLKQDMLGISFPQSDGSIKLQTRVIIEVVNDYTFILDKPFENTQLLPHPILDFKPIAVTG